MAIFVCKRVSFSKCVSLLLTLGVSFAPLGCDSSDDTSQVSCGTDGGCEEESANGEGNGDGDGDGDGEGGASDPDESSTAGLGTECEPGSFCESGACYAADNSDISACSECSADEDCADPSQTCTFDEERGYAVCAGTASDGDACENSDQCEPGSFCEPTEMVCRRSDLGEVNVALWNEETCQVDDNGGSNGPGDLEVLSMVLAEDSDPSDAIDDGTTVYYPSNMASSSCTFKLLVWGNGSTGTGGAHYPTYFNQLTSYGFVVAVAHTNLANSSDQPLLTSRDLVLDLNDDPDSIFYQKIDQEFGLLGKSLGAFGVGRELNEPEAVAGVFIANTSGPQDEPISKPGLFLTGDSDFLQQATFSGYEQALGEAIFAQASDPDSGHNELNERQGLAEIATTFMRCHLRNDPITCLQVSCEECQQEAWSRFLVKNIDGVADSDPVEDPDEEEEEPGGIGGGASSRVELPIESLYSATGTALTGTLSVEGYEILYPDPLVGPHPVITWGNATGGTPQLYQILLDHFASWGFIVVATTNTICSGDDLTGGVDLLSAMNDDPESIFHNQVDLGTVGASGHSLGAACAITAGTVDSRIRSVVVGNPAPGDSSATDVSLLIMGAEGDPIVRPAAIETIYDDSAMTPTIAGIISGGNHFLYMGNGGPFRGYATAWFMTELLNDTEAAAAFYGDCEICDHPEWISLERKGIE